MYCTRWRKQRDKALLPHRWSASRGAILRVNWQNVAPKEEIQKIVIEPILVWQTRAMLKNQWNASLNTVDWTKILGTTSSTSNTGRLVLLVVAISSTSSYDY